MSHCRKNDFEGYLYKVKKSTKTHDVPQASKSEEFVGSPKTRQTMEECGLIYLELHNTHQIQFTRGFNENKSQQDLTSRLILFLLHTFGYPWSSPYENNPLFMAKIM